MPKYCDKCGSEITNENAKFCDKCGASINQKENNTIVPNSTITCQKCGYSNPITTTSCVNCGTSFNTEIFKFLIIIGYICSVIEIIFGRIYFLIPVASLIISIYLLIKGNKKVCIHAIIIYLLSILTIFFKMDWIGFISLNQFILITVILLIILVILVIFNRKREQGVT